MLSHICDVVNYKNILTFSYDFYSYGLFIIVMGRKKLNRTKEEINEQTKLRMRKYYERHKDRLKKEKLERYYKNKKI